MKYKKDIGARLFGMSTRSWPVLPHALSAQADIEAPGGQRAGGFTVRLSAVRQSFLEGLLHGPKDSSVPIKKELAAELVSRHVHPGHCRHKHPAALKRAPGPRTMFG